MTDSPHSLCGDCGQPFATADEAYAHETQTAQTARMLGNPGDPTAGHTTTTL